MCGWVGLWQRGSGSSHAELYARINEMSQTLAHRGPDDAGAWVAGETGLALGFRRLAIVDLSPEGHQPMVSASGRYVLVFNGEIYNFLALRRELEPLGYSFRGHSDTEIILASIEEWGLEKAVSRFIGMFSLALWDVSKRELTLLRDRLGIKPVYYGWMGQTFMCGSELKALRNHPDFKPEIDREVLSLFMRLSYVPAPYSIYRGIRQLPPGCLLRLSEKEDRSLPVPVPYWSASQVARQGQENLFQGTTGEAIAELERRLSEAVGLRMIADVPLGAFLSGGVDSSTVVALMQLQSNRPVKTFSIGFHEAGYNEAEHARKVANHLGTDHTEWYITAKEAQAVIPRLPLIFDEPFSDSSQVPTFLVSQLARRSVTVSLSGDGGDELFGGYNRYFTARAIWKTLGWLPASIRRQLAASLVKIEPASYDRWLGWLGSLTAKSGQAGPVGDKLHKLAQVLAVKDSQTLYQRFISHWTQPGLVLGGDDLLPSEALSLGSLIMWLGLPDFVHNMMYLDTVTYLPSDILSKVDRASMAVSLEARVPLLDHRVVEFAWQLPLGLKIRKNQGKWILRQVLYKYVPAELIERPKMGFGVPIDSWLRGSLREWAENLLDEQRLRREGFFDPAPIRARWAEHLSGQRNWQYLLWDVLMFQGWLEEWGHPVVPTGKEQPSCAVL